MASSKRYRDFILEQLSGLDDVSYRAMMGEYIIYYRGKIIGGIYDDRFLVKDTESAREMIPDAVRDFTMKMPVRREMTQFPLGQKRRRTKWKQ